MYSLYSCKLFHSNREENQVFIYSLGGTVTENVALDHFLVKCVHQHRVRGPPPFKKCSEKH